MHACHKHARTHARSYQFVLREAHSNARDMPVSRRYRTQYPEGWITVERVAGFLSSADYSGFLSSADYSRVIWIALDYSRSRVWISFERVTSVGHQALMVYFGATSALPLPVAIQRSGASARFNPGAKISQLQ
jgi:hypothetical protein